MKTMHITKPIGERTRLCTKEEAKAMLEKIEVKKEVVVKEKKEVKGKVGGVEFTGDENFEELCEKIEAEHGDEATERKKLKELLKHQAKDKNQSFDLNNHTLVFSEYMALTDFAWRYFQQSAEDYFTNFNDKKRPVFLEIENKHVKYLRLGSILKMGRINKDKIPIHLNLLTKVKEIYLGNNNISKIENLDNNLELTYVHLSGNNIDYNDPDNKKEYDKLISRKVQVEK